MDTLRQYTEEIRETNVRLGWRKGNTTFGEYVALLHSEASEALEAYRDHRLGDPTRKLCQRKGRHNPEEDHAHLCKPEGVGSELADVLVRVLDMADVFGIDITEELVRKLAYNRTRPYQHGGRTLSDG
jgi:NTP pyrophosphatase (non-canonical NTP hydrolase)